MFQRAYGIALEAIGYSVAYDRTHLVPGTHREYSLDGFDSEISIKSGIALDHIPPQDVVYEDGMRYQERYMNPPKTCSLVGYFQTEQYFKNAIPQVLKAFTFKDPLSNWAAGYLNEIRYWRDSCFIHVRRQDYIDLQHVHGIPPLDYYAEAYSKIKPDHVFFFSDDMKWCKENFSSSDFTFVEGTTKFEDLQLMKACRHAIIANSSFSWWGAWLGDCQQPRTVIAPKQWFNTAAGIDDTDIVPARWRKI